MKKIYYFTFISILFSILISTNSVNAATAQKTFSLASNNDQIEALIEEASMLYLENDESMRVQKKQQIDNELLKLGVKNATFEEVMRSLPEKERVKIPTNTANISWYQTWQNDTYKSKTYEVQALWAVTASKNTNLHQSGITTIPAVAKPNYLAGSYNVISLAALTAVGGTKWGAALTVFDFFNGFVNGISRTSTITDVNGSHEWDLKNTVRFCYVKPYGESDNKQVLSYITNSVTLDDQITVSSYVDRKFQKHAQSKNYTIPAQGYSNWKRNAVVSYVDNNASLRSFVQNVQIKTKIDSVEKVLYTIYPAQPSSMSQIY